MTGLSNRAGEKGRHIDFSYIAKKAPLWAATAGYMALMAHAKLFAPMDALAPAACAAGVFSGLNPLCLLVGSALGDRKTLPACALTLSVYALWRWLEQRKRRRAGMQDVFCAMSAGAGALTGALLWSDGTLYALLLAGLSAWVAALMAPALTSALKIGARRETLLPDEQLSLGVHAAVGLFALRSWLPAPFSAFLAALCTLLASGISTGHGAIAGLLSGFSLAMAGESGAMGVALGISGLLAACVQPVGRWAGAASFFAGCYLCAALGDGMETGALHALPLALACAGYLLLPRAFSQRLRRLFSPRAGQISADKLSLRLRQRAEGRVRRLAGAFSEMREGYAVTENAADRQALLARMRESLCAGCEGYAACWSGQGRGAGLLLVKAAEEALSGRAALPFSQLPPDENCACRRASLLDRRITPITNALARKRQGELSRAKWRALLSQQMGAASDMLSQLADDLARPARPDEALARVAEAALERAGMRACQVQAVDDGTPEFYVLRQDGAWSAQAARAAARILSDELGEAYMPELVKNGGDPLEMRFVRSPALTVSAAAASRAAAENDVCGDSHMACPLPDGRYLLAISDGMGQGAEAAQESRETLRLTRAFFAANIHRQAAVPAINGLMLLRGEEMFSTLDMCVIDRATGEASFEKLGGCRSVVISGRKARAIPGGQLPLGILEDVQPRSCTTPLRPGDVVVLLSDGVADVLEDADILALAHENRKLPPLRLAAALLDLAVARGAKDDSTALVAQIRQKNSPGDGEGDASPKF